MTYKGQLPLGQNSKIKKQPGITVPTNTTEYGSKLMFHAYVLTLSDIWMKHFPNNALLKSLFDDYIDTLSKLSNHFL